MRSIQKALCILLSAVLLCGMALPARAAESDALLQLVQSLRKPTPTPEAPAEEPEEASSENDLPADPEDKTVPDGFSAGYVSVAAGTDAYRSASLSALAGRFPADGNACAVSASGDSLELAFVSGNGGQITVVYVSRAAVTAVSSSRASTLKTSLLLKKVPVYEGFPLPTIAFEQASEPPAPTAIVKPTPTAAPTATKKPSPTPVPTEAPALTPNPDAFSWRDAPTGLTATVSADGTKVTLSWVGNTLCTGYAVYQQLESGYKVLGTVSGADRMTFTNALPEGTYTFYVKPRNNSAVGYASAPVTVSLPDGTTAPTPTPAVTPTAVPTVTPAPTNTPGPTFAPTPNPDAASWREAPTGLTASVSADGTKVTLSWVGNTLCTGYAVYQQLENGYKVLGTVSGADRMTFTKALPEGTYTLYVKPRYNSAVGYASASVTVSLPDGTAPTPAPTETPAPTASPTPDPKAWRAAPTNVTAALTDDRTRAVINWTGNEYCTGYAVYEQLDSSYKVLGTVSSADTSSFTTKTLEPGTHTFYVKARNGSSVGQASETVTLLIPGSVSIIASGKWGELDWVLDENGKLVISGEGEMEDFTYSSKDAWRGYKYQIREVFISTGITAIAKYAFYECTKMLSVVIPDSVISIRDRAFSYCKGLTDIYLSENVTEIGRYAFYNCAGLTNVIIPEGVTVIPERAFAYCTNLKSVTIPIRISSIGLRAFDGCINLENIYYEGTKEQWQAIKIDSGNEPLQNANIIFTDDSIPIDNQTLKVGFENSLSEPVGQGMVKWQKLLAERNVGLTIELFPDSQLGNKNDLIDQMLLGEPIMTLADCAYFTDYGVKDMGIVYGPFLFDNWDQCWKLIESDWWNEQCAKLEALGIKMVAANWAYGARHTLTTKPVHTAADLKGLMIRVPTNAIQTNGFEVLGATPIGMPLGDVYTALQQGIIDGVENPLSTLYGRKHHVVAKYLILDGHVRIFTTWVCSTDWFYNLTPEQQKALIETGREAGIYNNRILTDVETYYLNQMKSEGVTVYKPTEADLDTFRALAENFYRMGKSFGWSDGLYETVKAAIGK